MPGESIFDFEQQHLGVGQELNCCINWMDFCPSGKLHVVVDEVNLRFGASKFTKGSQHAGISKIFLKVSTEHEKCATAKMDVPGIAPTGQPDQSMSKAMAHFCHTMTQHSWPLHSPKCKFSQSVGGILMMSSACWWCQNWLNNFCVHLIAKFAKQFC